MSLRKKSAIPSVRRRSRLFRSLACVLGAALLAASSSRAWASVTIGYDPLVEGNYGQDLSFSGGAAFYVPFVFDLGGPYSVDSIRLLIVNPATLSGFSLLITPTLGTDSTVPTALTTLSATGSMDGVFTFSADSPGVLTSGSIYYLRMAYTPESREDPQWVSLLSLSGEPPAEDDNPNTSGGPSGGPSGGVTLTPLMTLNPTNAMTFRMVNIDSSYTDNSGLYGISITASAVPEPTSFAMVVGGLTLGAALLFRQRRRR